MSLSVRSELLIFLSAPLILFTPFFAQLNSTEKLVVNVQSILHYLEDCEVYFYVRGHSGNLGNDKVDQLAKRAT
ncbi:hypothetical protein TNCV_666801 [Trichonephila clavipes]|uniref:RNase H type-1 domain-containing protein n=1 Tax=Trichonephila clavipes TaxID=2585209 RepID=A0A8X6VM41_TRICX|nr:hypothetical protein TNCV_666801 [Trichonephila clavipes]